jgi:hypothetical protein
MHSKTFQHPRLAYGIVIVLLLLAGTPGSAQQYLGTIQGEITDATGARIPGAAVTATENSTHFKRQGATNGAGAYSFPGLNPGTYTVTATASGFKLATRSNVTLTAGQLQQVDFNLSLGEATETVEVVGANSLLDTGSAQVATTLDTQEVTDLPNEGRDPYVQATLAAGVTNNGSGGYFQGHSSQYTNPFSGVAVQIASDGVSGHNRLTLDGIPNDPPERLSGATYAGFTPSPEAVQETKIGTSIFDAQIGHGDGTVTNVVIKSGANQFHGAAYYLFQNTYLNANLYQNVPNQNLCYPGTAGCSNKTVPTRRGNDQLSQTGFVVSGPVWIPHVYNGHNRTFFLFSYERYHSHVSNAFTGLMPDDKERAGDFSELCSTFNSAGLCTSGRQIYDPLSPIVTVNGVPTRTAYFPYNNIAGPNSAGVTDGLNPTGQALMSYFPSVGSNFSTVQNYISTDTSFPNNFPSMIGRLDQAIGSKNKLSAILFRSTLTQSTPFEGYPKGIGPPGTSEGGYTVYRNTRGGSLDDVQQISSSMVLDSRLGVVWHPFGLRNPYDQNFDLSTLKMSGTGLPYASFPGISYNPDGSTLAAGASGAQNGSGVGNNSQVSTSLVGSLEEILTKVWGRHSVRFGFEGNMLNYNVQTAESGFGGLVIDRTFTQLHPTAGDSTSGNAWASLLLGYQNAIQYNINPSYALHQLYVAPFVQDDWRVNDRLTLNLGFRWDYESPFTERYNKFVTGFCTTCANPVQAAVTGLTLNGGLQFATGSNRYPYPRDLNNFQPRLGMAYQLFHGTVLRAGYGIIYFNTIETPIGTGYSATTGNTSTGTGGSNETAGYTPATMLSNPFPNGVTLPTGSSLGLATGVGTNISFIDPNHVQPKAQQLALNIQQQFYGNLQVQIGYVNFRPSSLEVNQNINVLPQKYYSTSTDPATNLANQTALNATVPNPMYGMLPPGSLSSLTGKTIQQQLLYYPFPEFGSVTEDYRSIGHQRYDALQIQVSKPMAHHVSFQGSFTWNKLMNWNSFANNYGLGTPLSKVVDPGPSLIGLVYGTVELPSFATRPRYERLALGGWKLNTVMRTQNGSLISAPGSVYLIGDPMANAPRNFQRMFNTCYETQSGALVPTSFNSNGSVSVEACDATSPSPGYRQRYSYTVQSNPEYINERQRIYPLVDASLFKTFIIHEALSFEIRGEFFNIGNRPEFGGPGTGLNSSTYGLVQLNQVNDARTGELTARINF